MKFSTVFFAIAFVFMQPTHANDHKKQEQAMGNIFKILTPSEWEAFKHDGSFRGSPMDLKDGFIHASLDDQKERILQKFFKGIRPVVMIEINPKLLTEGSLKIEANKPGGDQYPHIYRQIPLTAVIGHRVIAN